jgi:ABC-type amino acid transport substrate-binding protein
MRSGLRAAAAALAALCLALPAGAEELTGTLKKVHDSGVLTIGYRESSIPFSYLDSTGKPIGYSIDLCLEIFDEIVGELDNRNVTVAYKKVTAESRIPALLAGEIDLECGSTTNNAARQKQVAFSPIFFVSGTKVLVRKDGGIKTWRDLKDKTIAVTAGTTNEAAVRSLSEKQKLGVNVVVGSDHAASFELVKTGKADGFATDDVLLYGLLATADPERRFMVVGDYLSYDPYGIMYRKDDPALAGIVERTFARLAESRELRWLYEKWLVKRLPSGERLDIPMSPQLAEIFHVLGLPE